MAATRFFRAQWRVLGRLPESGPSDRVRRTRDLVCVAPVAAAVDEQGGEFSSTGASVVLTHLREMLHLRLTDKSPQSLTWVPAGETQGCPSAGGSCGHSYIEIIR